MKDALQAKADFFARLGKRDEAIAAFKKTEEKVRARVRQATALVDTQTWVGICLLYSAGIFFGARKSDESTSDGIHQILSSFGFLKG